MMSNKLRASKHCRKQERSVFLRAILPRFLQETRKSETVGHTKPYVLKNPRFSKSGSYQDYCNPCGRAINPYWKGKTMSQETRKKLSEYLTGRRVGAKSPLWNPDREAVERKARAKKTAQNLIWNTITRCKQKKTDRTQTPRLFSRAAHRAYRITIH